MVLESTPPIHGNGNKLDLDKMRAVMSIDELDETDADGV